MEANMNGWKHPAKVKGVYALQVRAGLVVQPTMPSMGGRPSGPSADGGRRKFELRTN